MKPKLTLLLVFSFLLCFSSCMQERKKYLIGVSQCSEDSWRSKLESELEQSTYFNEDVQLEILSADDDVEQQKQQIEQLINDKVDLLIVSPQQTSSLSDAIEKAMEKHIPVILFDRKSDVDNYTAFMGADNYSIGKMLGEYVAAQLGGKGNIVEIAGEHGSSPATERHKGFNDVIKKYPGLKIVGFGEGDWKQISGEKCMEEILSTLSTGEDGGIVCSIDCVFGANDRIALGARTAWDRYKQIHKSSLPTGKGGVRDPIYVGVDALPTPGGGIEKVAEGKLTASAIYPTHGDDLISLALSILRGDNFERQNNMETSLVTADNASVLLMQHKEVVQQDEYIKKMHNRVDSVLSELGLERIIMWGIILVTLIIGISLAVTMRALHAKHRLNEALSQKNEELNKEKEIAEQQRDELEEQRDKWLDATTPSSSLGQERTDGEPAVGDEPKNEFMERFRDCLDKRLCDADLSVEDIGQELLLSRVQLYRKVKALTGKTPVEIIREERLKRANILLIDSSLSISEIAYRVGFSAPSYFTKCYKDFYGKTPRG